ncbi:MAG: cytochrome b N-terminal domain-containing protein [Desulfobacterales bacterium]
MQNENGLFNEFIRHLFPRMVRRQNLKITYTFCLGGLAFTAFMVLIATGLLLLFYYQPSYAEAFGSILFLESSVPAGLYIRSLHRLASHAFLVLIFLHTLRVILTGAFRKPRELNWIIGFCLLCLALFEAYTGYLLPMDQLALWATQTGMELIKTIPLGEAVANILAPDGVGQPISLLRFYILHIVIIPVVVLLLSFLHFYRIRQDKEVLPYL